MHVAQRLRQSAGLVFARLGCLTVLRLALCRSVVGAEEVSEIAADVAAGARFVLGFRFGVLRGVLDGLGHRERAYLARCLLRHRGLVTWLIVTVLGCQIRRVELDLVADQPHRGLAVTSLTLAVEADPLQLRGLGLQLRSREVVGLGQALGGPADVFGVLGRRGGAAAAVSMS